MNSLQDLTSHNFGADVKPIIWQLIFVTLGIGALALPTTGTDYVNRFLFTFKLCFFLLLIFSLLPLVDTKLLLQTPTKNIATQQEPYWLAIPIFFTAFGFHGTIPAIMRYMGPNPKHIKWAIIIGSFFPILFYTIWEIATLGTIPLAGPNGYESLIGQQGEFAHFMDSLSKISAEPELTFYVDFFTFFTIITSFIAVGMGLLDFFKESLQKIQIKNRNISALICTISVPLLISLLYPDAFIKALAFAAIALCFLAVIVPSLLVLKVRKTLPYLKTETEKYQVFGGNLLPKIIIIFGICIIGVELYNLWQG